MKLTQLAAMIALATAASACASGNAQYSTGTLHERQVGTSAAWYFVETNTHTCALQYAGLLAVDCALLAASVPELREFITWLPAGGPAEPPPAPAPTPAPPPT
jgi:hypothetical protein